MSIGFVRSSCVVSVSSRAAFVDDLGAEPGDEPRRGIGRRRVGRVGELVEVDRLLVVRGSGSSARAASLAAPASMAGPKRVDRVEVVRRAA